MNFVLSLFPGLELLDRAFRSEGFFVVAGPDRLLGGDIREFHAPTGRFDGVIGGSPCQSFSALANLVRAKGLEPRFGNLVPEFERVVEEAQPLWFLHENVPRAPIPQPAGYAVRDFTVCNSSIEGEDGLGQEQERVRRFTFGIRGAGPAPNLLRWIPRAALRLPAQLRSGAVSQTHVDNSPQAKGRVRVNGIVRTEAPGQRRPTKEVLAERSQTVDFETVAAHALNGSTAEMPDDFTAVSPTGKVMRFRKPAVLADARETPVAIGGSSKPKLRLPPLTGENGTKYETPRVRVPPVCNDHVDEHRPERLRQAAITGAHQTSRRPKGGHGERRSLPEMLRLQGLPEDLLDDQPFTAKAARKMVANGVPMPLGLAVARAVRMALESIADPAGDLLAWRDDEITALIRGGVSCDA